MRVSASSRRPRSQKRHGASPQFPSRVYETNSRNAATHHVELGAVCGQAQAVSFADWKRESGARSSLSTMSATHNPINDTNT